MEVDTLYWGIRELGESLQKRTFSTVELTESYLERSERLGPTLNAYATLTRDLALALPRPAARHTVCRQGSARCERLPNNLGSPAICKAGVRLQCDRHRAADPGWCDSDWEGSHDRAGRRLGLFGWLRLLHGSGEESVEH